MGIKPLYYYLDNDIFIFASETKSIKFYLNNRITLNKEAFRDI